MQLAKYILAGIALLLTVSLVEAQTVYKIESAWDGKVLDVVDGSTENGAQIQQWTYTTALWQRWVLEDAGDGTVKIRNYWSGKVLDVTSGSQDNGAMLQQWDDTGALWQRWTVEDSGSGTLLIKNYWSKKALDVTGGSADNGARIQQWDYTSALWQQWRLVPADGNVAPSPSISVEGHSYGDTVTTGTNITVHFAATDADGNLTGIRYNVWNSTTGYFDNGGGGFIGQSGFTGDVAQSITLDTAGTWYVWTDTQDASGSYATTGALESGLKIIVVDNRAPVPSIAVAGLSSGKTVTVGTQVTVTYSATDPDGNLAGIRYNLWNSTTNYFSSGDGSFISQSGYSGQVVKTFTLDTAGVWYFWTDAQDANGAYASTGAWTSGFQLNVITVIPLSVSFSNPPPATIGVGQKANCDITGVGTGLNEIGLDLCSADGTLISNIGSASSSSSTFPWMGTSPGAFYLRGYAVNASGQKVYTSLRLITVSTPVVATTTSSSIPSYWHYNADNSVRIDAGQTIKYDTVTNYIMEARLYSGIDQYLNYGPGRSTVFLKNSMIRFSGGYVSDGYMNNPWSSVELYYGPDRSTSFLPCSHIKFVGGYVADGYMNNSGDSVSLPYGPDRSTNFGSTSHIKFADGYVSDGYMKNSGNTAGLYYGPGRTTDFGATSHVRFAGGYVLDGYLYSSANSVSLQYGSAHSANFLPHSHATFADGYVKTGYLVSGTNYYSYSSSSIVKITNNPVVNIDSCDKSAVANIVGRNNAAWTAIAKALLTQPFNTDGSISISEADIDNEIKQYIEILDAAVDAFGQLPAIYSDYNNLSSLYTVHIQYPPIAFTPGADGTGYISLGQVAIDCSLFAKDGVKSVKAGTVCIFADGYYVP